MFYLVGCTILSFFSNLLTGSFDKSGSFSAAQLGALALYLVVMLAEVLFSIYFTVRVIGYSLRKLGYSTREFGFGIKVALASIGQQLAAAVLWMDKRFMIAFAIVFFLLTLFVVGLAIAKSVVGAMIVFFLFLLVAIPYGFFVLYHAMRLYFVSILFLAGRTFSQAMQESWALTKGRVLRVFGAVALAAFLFFLVILFPFGFYLVFLEISDLGASIVPAFHFVSSVLRIPVWLVIYALSIGFTYFHVGMFHSLMKETSAASTTKSLDKPKTIKQPAVKPKPVPKIRR